MDNQMGLKNYALALSLLPVLCSFPVHAAAGPPAAIARAAQSAPLSHGCLPTEVIWNSKLHY